MGRGNVGKNGINLGSEWHELIKGKGELELRGGHERELDV
jgi:hypothetical protein